MMVSSQTETAVGFKCMVETLMVVALYGNVLNLGKLINIHETRLECDCSNVLGSELNS